MEHIGTTVAAPARPDRPRPAEEWGETALASERCTGQNEFPTCSNHNGDLNENVMGVSENLMGF